jgi:toxin ParE1/3/4
MSGVRCRPQAEEDLFEIALYIARDNPSASDEFLDTMNDKFKRLAASPLMGRARPELFRNLRSFPVGNYVIFYRPLRAGIEVIRVLSAARDIPSLL